MRDLASWKDRSDRKPLILLGARQVGKTYILREFGKRFFDSVAYVNCDNNEQAKDLFANGYDIPHIVFMLSAITGVDIKAGKTLIIFDEIQELPHGLASLKYFCEDAPQYHVAVAGSLLGICMHQGESYPVGKVNTLRMFPMTFDEFLLAKGYSQLVDILHAVAWSVLKPLRTTLCSALREYYFVGGMPEAVNAYVATNSAVAVREIQNEILLAYEKDISKHASSEQSVRIGQVWRSIPSQLAKENRKFLYGVIKKGARAREYELAIQWLIDAGLVHQINRVNLPAMPLKIHEDFSAFKLFLLDCGLLGAMNNTPPATLLTPQKEEAGKGAFTENFVCTQLATIDNLVVNYYTKESSRQELDFVLQAGAQIVPVEVKAEENLQSKSLKAFLAENPDMHGLRFSMSDYCPQERLTNVPLYAAEAYVRSLMRQEL